MRHLNLLSLSTQRDAERFFCEFKNDRGVIFRALLAAEDHRGINHRGIDWLSLIRALLLFPMTRRVRGISTIEQQYVRTILKRRDKNLFICKSRELFDSWWLANQFSKEIIWAAYLFRAYYGSGLTSYSKARQTFNGDAVELSFVAAAQIVACLKYPRPRFPNIRWNMRHEGRVKYIIKRIVWLEERFTPITLLPIPKNY